MTINVIQADIDNAVHNTCKYCPVANAITRVTKRVALVGIYDFNFIDNYSKSYLLPLEVKNKIRSWDSGFNIEPFIFEINID